jgi:molybdopterin converting factor subunit 1
VEQATRPVRLKYFAILREQRGLAAETVETAAVTAGALSREIAAAHGFTLSEERVGVAVNDAFASWDRPLAAGDTVVFIPPVAGG